MFTNQKKNRKSRNKLSLSDRKSYRRKNNKYSKLNILPPINQSKDIFSTIKGSSITGSINFLYHSLFPDEKNTLERFLYNYSNKYNVKPKWKFSTTKPRNDDKIRNELMKRNRTMRSFEYLRKPTKMKKIKIIKPKMVQIIEDNFEYKYRIFPNL